ncbi:hypothetical protein THMIRHAS_19400 [Thiosulfatimonas sediminis]|uniref:Response regulatory domain-containing protein n=1 Tax=Thiosulfatimonas sediminis TaxID=2675054 RepID=A0A6F8PX01_9GAMM|nr:response regulator [Thiosulfatimonas sediminis]BBP46567.1 hypothetical protein THMIRHAS_19400 [Thiosulfatimonas sediminis]
MKDCATQENINVFAVDDSEVICSLLKITLEKSGLHLTLSRNLGDAKQIVQSTQFDLIIVDYMLSIEDNGLQLVEFLKETINAATPVLMLSAEIDEPIKQRAKQLGVKAWMKKPFSPDSITELSQRLLANQNIKRPTKPN